MGQGINTLSLELDDKEALALAQFVKRLTWSDLRGCAVDDDEAYVIKDAVDKLQRAMAEEGFPRDSAVVFHKRASKFLNALFLPSLLTLCFYSLRVFGAGVGQLLPATWATQPVVQVH